MASTHRVRGWRTIVPWLLLLGCSLLPASARAAPVTVTWDVVPLEGELEPTPYYNCDGDSYGSRRCSSLWEEGLEFYAVDFDFYDDKWFDGYGWGSTEQAAVGMRPRCEPTLAPCFDTFTPIRLVISGHANDGPDPNLFVVSSHGEVARLPSVQGFAVIDFSPSQPPIEWLEIGFYLPTECELPDDPACNPSTEKAFVVESLTFEAGAVSVPEPALVVLLATGVLGLVCRRRTSA